jgi:hypothetical protein
MSKGRRKPAFLFLSLKRGNICMEAAAEPTGMYLRRVPQRPGHRLLQSVIGACRKIS